MVPLQYSPGRITDAVSVDLSIAALIGDTVNPADDLSYTFRSFSNRERETNRVEGFQLDQALRDGFVL